MSDLPPSQPAPATDLCWPLPSGPIPGGCSQTEAVPDAPFFRVEVAHDAYSVFTVPRAQLGIDRSVETSRQSLPDATYVKTTASGKVWVP